MKTIKISLITVLLMSFTLKISAQEYKVSVQNTKEWSIVLKDFSGDLPIEGYSGNEIIIASAAGKVTPPDKAKGLKAIYPAGTDNTGVGLDVQKNGTQVTVTCLLPFTQGGEYKIKVPDNLSLSLESGCERSNSVTISNLKNEIDVKNCHDIDLTNVTGPLVLSTISGNINITFGTINSGKPFSVNTISGNVDITLPAKTGTNLVLRTIDGGFYSDFDITDTEKNLKRIGGSELKYALNGGGFSFSIETVNGNIYLRKGK